MLTTEQAWTAGAAPSIEGAAALMKETARAKAAQAQETRKAKTKPPAVVVEGPAPDQPRAKRGRPRGVKAPVASGPVSAIRSAIANHQAEIVRLKGALRLLRGAA